MSDTNPHAPQFNAIAKGSILSSIENKHVQYIGMADRRAQGLLTIASILIPFSLTKIGTEESQLGVIVFSIGAFVTIIMATLCLMPKRYSFPRGSKDHLLHFSGISRMSEEEYIERMAEVTTDTPLLAKEMARDLYHLSQDVLLPKFRWLRLAYFSFVASLFLGIAFTLHGYLTA